ncbi:Nuclear speckle splicing regulatory protein 1 [Holothuria leucospilota]|uniref:Nuclear speckle splicing regulatory protein 1 n=1 Tax=Holothuria leucospilota TaxID=206669 RepID=A0A9Q1CFD1_HOLLE|nr:Nuclear speckle splicing regulatory protein 1 [Holothuria leucospilota]
MSECLCLHFNRYGLINMKKAKPPSQPLQKKLAIFDESDDEDTPQSAINQKLQQEAVKTKMRKQTKMEIQKAMEEDPTVFEYDSIYDDMEQKKQEKERILKTKQRDSKPKYMSDLMKAAKQRKMERERQKERKIQKEREKEGDEFGDKEQFVTASYKKKMQELAEDEERERREAEGDGDVTKEMDLTGFYRHILDQTTGTAVEDEKEGLDVKREISPFTKGKEEYNERRKDRDVEDKKGERDGKRDKKDKGRKSEDAERRLRQKDDERDRNRNKEGEGRRDTHRGERDRERQRYDEIGYNRDSREGRRDSGVREGRGHREDRRDKERDYKKDRRKDCHNEERGRSQEKYSRLHDDRDKLEHEVSSYEEIREEDSKSVKRYADDGESENDERSNFAVRSTRGVEKKSEDADSDLDISEEENDKGRMTEQKKEREMSEEEVRRVKEEERKKKYARRTTTDTVMSARERYMARKLQRDSEKSHIAVEEDE